MKRVIGLYDNLEEAHDAVSALVDHGISRENISLVTRDFDGEYARYFDDDAEEVAEATAAGAVGGGLIGGLGGLLLGLGALAIPGVGPIIAAGPIAAALTGAGVGAATGGVVSGLLEWGIESTEAEFYAEGLRRGGTLVAAKVADGEVDRVIEIMNAHGPVDMEQRTAAWRESGWKGFDDDAPPYTRDDIDRFRNEIVELNDSETFEVVEEEVRVGKREVQTGGIRVHKWVESEPVEEEVTLREERVVVERRPVDRQATEADIDGEEAVFEVTETAEELVVDKRARVVEEVVIGKQVEEHTETVTDTVRKTRVEVESLDGNFDADGYAHFQNGFRRHFAATPAFANYDYERYEPAYRYGYTLATDDRYRDSDWETLEPTARRRWEADYDGPWDDFKDAVRHAWNEVKEEVREAIH